MSGLIELFETRIVPLSPTHAHVEDESSRHAGHAGNNGGGHLRATIVSPAFSGKNTMARHRMVYSLVNDLMPHRIHALSLTTLTPDEAQQRADRL